MGRNKKKVVGLNLLFHSSGGEAVEAPKQIKLPDSVVETKPRETVVIMVSPEVVLVQGRAAISTIELIEAKGETIVEITEGLKLLERNIIGISTKTAVGSKEVTILADKSIPFSALKKIMSTCTGSGYGRISLAVIQKAAQK
jgi:biopolymer transport protein ExbD